MNFPYIVFEITLLILPFIGLIISNLVTLPQTKSLLLVICSFFLTHNILFYLGYSIKGDRADYLIFSMEYLLIIITILSYRRFIKTIYTKVLAITAYAIWIIGIIVGIPAILFFIVVSDEYQPDRIFTFKSNENNYYTRRYTLGFATLDSDKYTFDTYRNFEYLPIEKKIDQSIFFNPGNGFSGVDGDLKLRLVKINGEETLIFQSPGKGKYVKKLK